MLRVALRTVSSSSAVIAWSTHEQNDPVRSGREPAGSEEPPGCPGHRKHDRESAQDEQKTAAARLRRGLVGRHARQGSSGSGAGTGFAAFVAAGTDRLVNVGVLDPGARPAAARGATV